MAFSYSFRVLENGARDMILQVQAFDSSTGAIASGAGTTSNGILNANSLPLSTHTKVRRLLFTVSPSVIVRVQWHATSNVDIALLAANGDYNLDYARSGCQGIFDDGGSGVTGDIDIAPFYATAATGASGPSSFSFVLFMVKGT